MIRSPSELPPDNSEQETNPLDGRTVAKALTKLPPTETSRSLLEAKRAEEERTLGPTQILERRLAIVFDTLKSENPKNTQELQEIAMMITRIKNMPKNSSDKEITIRVPLFHKLGESGGTIVKADGSNRVFGDKSVLKPKGYKSENKDTSNSYMSEKFEPVELQPGDETLSYTPTKETRALILKNLGVVENAGIPQRSEDLLTNIPNTRIVLREGTLDAEHGELTQYESKGYLEIKLPPEQKTS